MNELKPSPALHCANCEAVLQGEFCHGCGQSIHSVLRPISHMLEDAGDIFFHMDERIVHTVPPLYTKPGFLTLEYFSGRRVRYIAPFRLMFVFCLLCFFFMHVAINGLSFGQNDRSQADTLAQIAQAEDAEDVHDIYTRETRVMLSTQADPNVPAAAKAVLGQAHGVVFDAANKRLAELNAPAIKPQGSGGEDDVKPREVKIFNDSTGEWTFHAAWVPMPSRPG